MYAPTCCVWVLKYSNQNLQQNIRKLLKFHTHISSQANLHSSQNITYQPWILSNKWWWRLPRQVVAARCCLPAAVHGYHTRNNMTQSHSLSLLFFPISSSFLLHLNYITSLHTRWMPRARRRPRSSKLNFNKKQRPRQMPPPSRSGKRLKMPKSKKVIYDYNQQAILHLLRVVLACASHRAAHDLFGQIHTHACRLFL